MTETDKDTIDVQEPDPLPDEPAEPADDNVGD
jgi:hypothetical protein